MRRATSHFWPYPLGPWGGVKRSISINFNYKVNFKYFYSKTVFFILLPGSSPRGGTWEFLGAKIELRPAVCPLAISSLNHWTKSNQIWCVSYSPKWSAQRYFFAPPPGALGRGQKVKYHFSITKSISKILIPNFVRSHK